MSSACISCIMSSHVHDCTKMFAVYKLASWLTNLIDHQLFCGPTWRIVLITGMASICLKYQRCPHFRGLTSYSIMFADLTMYSRFELCKQLHVSINTHWFLQYMCYVCKWMHFNTITARNSSSLYNNAIECLFACSHKVRYIFSRQVLPLCWNTAAGCCSREASHQTSYQGVQDKCSYSSNQPTAGKGNEIVRASWW